MIVFQELLDSSSSLDVYFCDEQQLSDLLQLEDDVISMERLTSLLCGKDFSSALTSLDDGFSLTQLEEQVRETHARGQN